MLSNLVYPTITGEGEILQTLFTNSLAVWWGGAAEALSPCGSENLSWLDPAPLCLPTAVTILGVCGAKTVHHSANWALRSFHFCLPTFSSYVYWLNYRKLNVMWPKSTSSLQLSSYWITSRRSHSIIQKDYATVLKQGLVEALSLFRISSHAYLQMLIKFGTYISRRSHAHLKPFSSPNYNFEARLLNFIWD